VPTRAAPRRPAATSPAETAPGWLVWTALGIVYVVWGSTYLAIKVAIETLPTFLHGGVRFLIAAAVLLLAIAAVRRSTLRMTRAEAGTASLAGVLLLLGGNGLVTLGEEEVDSGLAALLIAAVPLWIVVLRAMFRDRPSAATLSGVMLGFVGVAVLLLPGAGTGETSLRHALFVLAASLSWAIGSFVATRRPMPADPFVATGVEMLAGGLALLAVALARGEVAAFDPAAVSGRSWVALAYLVVFGSLVAFTAFVWLLGVAAVSKVATYAYVNPVVAVLLGALLLDERVTPPVLAGGAIIVAAVAIVVTEDGRKARRQRRDEETVLAAAPHGDNRPEEDRPEEDRPEDDRPEDNRPEDDRPKNDRPRDDRLSA